MKQQDLNGNNLDQEEKSDIIVLGAKGNAGSKGMRERSAEGPRLNQQDGEGEIEVL